MMQHKQTHKTISGGSINYGYYDRRARKMRSLAFYGVLSGIVKFVTGLPAKFSRPSPTALSARPEKPQLVRFQSFGLPRGQAQPERQGKSAMHAPLYRANA